MPDRERRKGYDRPSRAMERELNDEQVVTLRQLERYGWELKFIRHVPFQPSVAVLFDSDRSHYAILREDGTLDEQHAGFDIRH
ncbi:MAG TPA: hypothetical protein VFL14_07245 [Xanthomonadales bacterium]|nr:hypothetical protein [Xanthomonadales bacterium]